MFTVKTTPQFDSWLDGLKDKVTAIRLRTRIKKATLGNLGDVAPVGGGISEMREHFGPGWRLYYAQRATC